MTISDSLSRVEKFTGLVKATIGKEPIHPPPPAKLGYYYGFRVHIPEEIAKRSELPAELNVYHGVVTVNKKREQEHWRDVAGVEQFLINQAREQGYGNILEKTGGAKSE